VGQILSRLEQVFLERRPDRVLILGDTTAADLPSSLVDFKSPYSTWRLEIDAMTSCSDESNRRIIDHISSILMPYTNRGRENLLAPRESEPSTFASQAIPSTRS